MNSNTKRFFYRHAILVLAPCALVVAACVSDPYARSPAPVPDLAGTHWTVTSIDGREPLRSDELTTDFGVDGHVNGDSGCNHFSGPFVQTGSTVNFGELLSTRRACVETTRQRQEDRMLDIMRGATTAQWLRDDELRLRSRAGSITLVRAESTNAAYVDESLPRRMRYDCQGVEITVEYGRTTARVTDPDGYDELTLRSSENGLTRYESAHSELRIGRDMLWGREGGNPRSCVEKVR